ncbi:OmpA family protein [Aquabacterium sp. OR-4]|uniref:OmpA family protein n=1 Tax=Aquabacterium sp. OR-4 TaxID=2978127 RepID=UPI0021B34F30|nr:OmpA family protein [Aquabacterium sp. OR-4]MDT7834132.1 OmpA family protein [Aquabacterium sp. OR-4]
MNFAAPHRPHRPQHGAKARAGLTAARLATAAALALCAALPATAQTAPAAPLLKAAQVTEDALVDALEIAPAASAAASGATRAIRPSMRPGVPAKPPGPGKASLLITFATGSSDITPETVAVLEKVAKALQSDRLAGFGFRVEGHADPRGGDELNQKLSAERAQAVVSYLTTKLGVLPERLSSVGKGASELLNAQKADAPENRRVTIVTTQ